MLRLKWPFLCFVAAVSFSPLAKSSLVVLDFEDVTAPALAGNIVAKGFRVSPVDELHVLGPNTNPAGVVWPSKWIGTDGVGNNPNFLGDESLFVDADGFPRATLWMDYFGNPFTFVGFTPIVGFFEIRSSAGGFAVAGLNPQPPPIPNTFTEFSGPQWTNISWIAFTLIQDVGVPRGFDNVTFRTPIPGTLVLLASGLLGFAAVRRKCARSPTLRLPLTDYTDSDGENRIEMDWPVGVTPNGGTL